MKAVRILSLAGLAVALLVAADLGLNYWNAAFIEVHDGVVCSSLFRPLFGDGGWSVYGFFRAFAVSLWVVLAVTLENIVLGCIDIYRRNAPLRLRGNRQQVGS